jgi:hypothetical protein
LTRRRIARAWALRRAAALRRRLGLAAAGLIAVAALALLAGPVEAELGQVGDVIVFLNGGIVPRKLPRTHLAPVGVRLEAGIRTADRSPLPRVRKIRLELAWRGLLDTRGLPVCREGQLLSVDSQGAMRVCGGALVGRGHIYARVFLPDQDPFGLHAQLLAFNGRTKVGRPAIWVLVYATQPPLSVVLPFHVRHQRGPFRTVLVSVVPHSVGPWPHFAHFYIDVSRRFTYRGHARSYLSASCPLPRRFTVGFLSFARATFYLANAVRPLRAETVSSCSAR